MPRTEEHKVRKHHRSSLDSDERRGPKRTTVRKGKWKSKSDKSTERAEWGYHKYTDVKPKDDPSTKGKVTSKFKKIWYSF